MSELAAATLPRINSVMPGLGVADMARAVAFYEGKLGFRVAFRNGAVFTIVGRDGIEISLGLDRAGAGAGRGHAYLKVQGIDAFHDEFVSAGVALTHALRTESYGMREFMITDPDGNTLNFGEPVQNQGQARG